MRIEREVEREVGREVGREVEREVERDAQRAEVLTTKGAAVMLGVAVSTVQQWVDAGLLACWTTPGGHRRIPSEAVRQLMGARHARRDVIATAPTQAATPSCLPMPAGGFPVAHDDDARSRAAVASGLFDSAPQPAYDRLVRLAGQVTGMPIAVLSLLGHDRQWFKARIGTSLRETPRAWAFCNYAVLGDELLEVHDARRDDRFKNNPLVTGEEAIRFYSGSPLHDRDGFRIGTLCVLDRVPRRLSAGQAAALTELAAMASEELQRS